MPDPVKVYDGPSTDYWFDTQKGVLFSTDNDGNKLPEPAYVDWKDNVAVIKWDDTVQPNEKGSFQGAGDNYLYVDFLAYANTRTPMGVRNGHNQTVVSYDYDETIMRTFFDDADAYARVDYSDVNKNQQFDAGDSLVVQIKADKDGTEYARFHYSHERGAFVPSEK